MCKSFLSFDVLGTNSPLPSCAGRQTSLKGESLCMKIRRLLNHFTPSTVKETRSCHGHLNRKVIGQLKTERKMMQKRLLRVCAIQKPKIPTHQSGNTPSEHTHKSRESRKCVPKFISTNSEII